MYIYNHIYILYAMLFDFAKKPLRLHVYPAQNP